MPPDMLPYLAPIFAYIALGGVEGYLPKVNGQLEPTWYLVAYSAKVLVAAMLAWWYRATWADLRPTPTPGVLTLAALLGVSVG